MCFMVPCLISKRLEDAVIYEIVIHPDLIPVPPQGEGKVQKSSRNGNGALNICYRTCNSILVTSKLNSELSRLHMPVIEIHCGNTVPFEQL